MREEFTIRKMLAMAETGVIAMHGEIAQLG
jgi:hypothetical protein